MNVSPAAQATPSLLSSGEDDDLLTKAMSSLSFHVGTETVALKSQLKNDKGDDGSVLHGKGASVTTSSFSDRAKSLVIARDQEQNRLWETWEQVVSHRNDQSRRLQTSSAENDSHTAAAKERTQYTATAINGTPTNPSSQQQICLVEVHGPSGVGKSHLVESLRRRVVEETNGIFVSSKFDQWGGSTSLAGRRFPFHTIADILSDICDVLAARPDATTTVKQGLAHAMDPSDWVIFTQYVSVPFSICRERSVIPMSQEQHHERIETDHKVNEPPSRNPESTHHHEHSVDPFRRLQWAARQFLRYVSTLQPLFIFLDDIQWADDESMRMIRSLLNVAEHGNPILFVVAVRSQDDEWLSTSRRESHHSLFHNDPVKATTRLVLENWSQLQVQNYISELLLMSTEEIEECQVGSIIHQKTNGNAFFVSQFLELLRIKGMLFLSPSSGKWEWRNVKEILRFDVSEGVLSSVDARVYDLSPSTRSILVLAAHIGFEFKVEVLMVVSKEYQSAFRQNGRRKTLLLDDALMEAEQANLILRGRDAQTMYFMHDRVRESLYEMVADGELKERMYLRIGRRVKAALPELSKNGDNLVILTATDAMNEGRRHISAEGELVDLIRLNLQAAQATSSFGSFASAASYLEIARTLIPANTFWTKYYALSMEVHEKLALMKCNCGELDDAHSVVDTILRRAQSVVEKQSAYEVRFLAFSLQGKNEESIRVALSALKELGVVLPYDPSPFALIAKMARIRWLLRGRKPTDLLSLKSITDKKAIFTFLLVRQVALLAGMIGHQHLCLLAAAHAFVLTLQLGRTKWSANAVAAYGILQYIFFRDIEKAEESGDVANRMLAVSDTAEDDALTRTIIHFTLSWKQPMIASIQPLKRAFDSGLHTGDTYNGSSCLSLSVLLQFLSGAPLARTEKEAESCIHRISGFAGRTSTVFLWSTCVWQTILNLRGDCEDPIILSGKAMNEEDVLENSTPEAPVRLLFLMMKIQLACHFRSLEASISILHQVESKLRAIEVFPADIITMRFFMALTYVDILKGPSALALYRRDKRTCTARLRQTYRFLRRLANNDCHYADSVVGIIVAEMKSSLSTGHVQTDLFDEAIAKAVSNGFLNYASLACERAAFALIGSGKRVDDESVHGYLARGEALNREWEALGKVQRFQASVHRTSHDESESGSKTIPKAITALSKVPA